MYAKINNHNAVILFINAAVLFATALYVKQTVETMYAKTNNHNADFISTLHKQCTYTLHVCRLNNLIIMSRNSGSYLLKQSSYDEYCTASHYKGIKIVVFNRWQQIMLWLKITHCF